MPSSPPALWRIWRKRRVSAWCTAMARESCSNPPTFIYVNAGATRPADIWLDRLKEGGRLILPLTADGFPNRDVRHGAVFRIERRGPFNKGGAERVTRLYRRDDLPEDQFWLRAPGWCLAYR